MKKIYLCLFALLGATSVFAQALFNNNGADIYVKDGGLIVVKTNSLYNKQIAGVGVIDNAGTIVVEGNITNDGSINAAGDTVRLTGDWTNNNAYAGNNSWVDMYGGNQLITGTAVTTFNNLNLGGGSVVKRQQNIDAVTSGELRLNDAELATDANEMLVTNANTNAIIWNNGFVSSVTSGKLSRATSTTGAYVFPVGSASYNNPPSIFRPIEFAPTASAANTYGAMVVKSNATSDGYNINTLDDVLCKVNSFFYHRLYHSSGADAVALKMFFDPSTDGDWTDQAHWDVPNRWNYNGTPALGNGLGFSTVNVAAVNDFQPEPFALARKKFTVDAGLDVDLTLGQSTTFNPTISAPVVTSYSWTPVTDLSCSSCEGPEATPSVTTQYLLIVADDAGCVVSDSLVVRVTSPELLIPTGFSPNGDGVNDVFRALNKNLAKYTLQVYNRWGEKLFETTDPTEGWDGIYQGINQPMEVYTWQCEYLFAGAPSKKTAKGNVTLVR